MADGADVKPDIKPDALNLVVKDQDGGELHFKVKPHTKFEKIFAAYAAKKSTAVNGFKFLFDGTRLRPDQTPGEVGIESEDAIDAVLEQTGGADAAGPSGGGGGEQKPDVDVKPALNINLKNAEGNSVQMKVRHTTKFRKIFEAYGHKKGIANEQVRFLFDGQRLATEQTPGDVDMEDQDVIEVQVEALGGSRC